MIRASFIIRCANFVVLIVQAGAGFQCANGEDLPLKRAIAFLEREVRNWPVENHCFSCHNNGDGARVLYLAQRMGYAVDPDAMATATEWLSQPASWHDNGADEEFKDKKLAAIQFGSALAEAVKSESVGQEQALAGAAKQVADHQRDDGSWNVDKSGLGGSPITYGDCLATAVSQTILLQSNREAFRSNIEKAGQWLRSAQPFAVSELAGQIIGLSGAEDNAAIRQRARALSLIAKAKNRSGAWGQFASYRSEPFDTGIVLVALSTVEKTAEIREMISHGRQYLISTQLKDGSWPGTTRPAGTQSYAHRISTTAWATHGLLMTEGL